MSELADHFENVVSFSGLDDSADFARLQAEHFRGNVRRKLIALDRAEHSVLLSIAVFRISAGEFRKTGSCSQFLINALYFSFFCAAFALIRLGGS